MTGQDLLHGLSFVDERFIAEADTAVLSRKIPWMKVLSVAACLCILIVGAFALENMGHKSAKEESAAPAAAAPEAMQESATEAAPPMPAEEECITEAAEGEIPYGELQHVPQATLQIVKVLDDGSFEAVVEAVTREPTPLELGMQVKMVVDPSKIPGETREIQNDLSKILVDAKVRIENGAYDAEKNILYAAEVFFAEEE